MADLIGSGRSIAAATTAMQLMAAPVAVLQIVHFHQIFKYFQWDPSDSFIFVSANKTPS